jgi:hypothetical protein
MNPLKSGPEIKLPEMKVPGFLSDLYYDLRDRRLLPLVAVLAVAIVAVPIAFSDSSIPEAPPVSSAIATPGVAVDESGLVVARAAPGLRDYHRRLDELTARNPFKQQYTQPVSANGESSGPSGSDSGSATSADSTSTGTTTYTPSTSPSGSPTGELRYFTFAIDVRVVQVPGRDERVSPDEKGSSGEPKATVRRNLPPLTPLPGRDTPAATYMGVSKDRRKALLLISDNVRSIFGDARCVVGTQSCQLLAMEPGVPVTLVWGANGRTFRIELLKIELVVTDELNKAPLGKPDKNSAG